MHETGIIDMLPFSPTITLIHQDRMKPFNTIQVERKEKEAG